VLPWQTFWDVQFNGQLTETHQHLNLGWGSTIDVTLDAVHPSLSGEQGLLDLEFTAYSSTGASAYKTWYGINP
jgi:hypothetical protein